MTAIKRHAQLFVSYRFYLQSFKTGYNNGVYFFGFRFSLVLENYHEEINRTVRRAKCAIIVEYAECTAVSDDSAVNPLTLGISVAKK